MPEINMQIKNHNGTEWEKLNPKTTKEQVQGLTSDLETIQAIAEGASRARVFDTTAALDAWLAVTGNKAELRVGDNFYTRATAEADYWWDGAVRQPLSTEKVILENASAQNAGLMSSEDFTKLAGLTNYTHPTGDGNQHVPATGTGNGGKVLKAGATAGSAAWGGLTADEVGAARSTILTVGLVPPSNPQNGDVWFDYNN